MSLLVKEKEQKTKSQILKGEKNIKVKKSFFAKFCTFMANCIILGSIAVLFLMYGPYKGFREWYITTAMTTMTHQYLATWFYSSETIAEVLDNNKMVEVQDITDTSLINGKAASSNQVVTYKDEYDRQVLERDPAHPEYKIVEISGKSFTGYAAFVYDPSKIHTMVTENLNKSGQYVTKMAEKNKAVLAVNGGFFIDLKEDRTGGTPQGITIANGKVVTNKVYTGEGGLVGFDENNNLIVGKLTAAQAEKMKIRDAVTTGPFLIVNGQASKVVGNGGWGTAPRTAIGQREDGVIIFLVIDGRRVGKAGATMNQLIELMQKYGAVNAAALDGGTSSVLVENYKILNDPINSDGVHKTRPVATAFGLMLDDNDKSKNSK